MKKICLTVFACAFLCICAFSQTSNSSYGVVKTYTAPTPEMSAYQRYGDVPVNYNTGIPDIKVPLGAIKLKGFDWPVYLGYHAGGNKVGEPASVVGLGWTLQASGFISAKLIGEGSTTFGRLLDLPQSDQWQDDQTPVYNSDQDVNDATEAIEGHTLYNPDIYYINLPTMNVKFLENYTVPSSDIKITWGSSAIYVQDNSGTTYTFGQVGYTSSTVTGALSNAPPVRSTPTYALTRIDTYNGEYITFNYSTVSYTFQTTPSEVKQTVDAYDCARCQSDAVLHTYTATVTQYVSDFRLTSIEASNGQKAVFEYSSRTDHTGNQRLTHVAFYNYFNGAYQLDYDQNLAQTYFGSSGNSNLRLKLDQVQKVVDKQAPETYTFEYNSVELPPLNSKNIDFQGYYNGASNSSLLPSTGNRAPDIYYAQASVLTRITYPAGGHTAFTYELNAPVWSGLRIKKIEDQDTDNAAVKQRSYTYQGALTSYDFSNDFKRFEHTYFFGSLPNGYETMDFADLITCNIITEQSSPIVLPYNLFFDNPVNYPQVTELLDNYNVSGTPGYFGKTEYLYNNHINYNNREGKVVPFAPVLTEKKIYKYNGSGFTLIKSEEYDYEVPALPNPYLNPYNSAFWDASANQREARFWLKDLELLHGEMVHPSSGIYPKSFRQVDVFFDAAPLLLKTSIIKDYSAAATITEQTDNTFNVAGGVLGPVTIEATGSDGKVLKTEIKYSNSSLSSMGYTTGNLTAIAQALTDNLIMPVWKKVSVDNAAVFENQVYHSVINSKALPVKEVTKPTGTSATKQMEVLQYDSRNNPLEVLNNGFRKEAYRYNTRNELTAVCSGAAYADFAFASFDDATGSGFSYSSGGVYTSDAYASPASYNISSGNINASGISTSQTYVLAGYFKSASISVSGATVTNVQTSPVISNGWYYLQETLTPTSGTITISGSGLTDELRLYPSQAVLKTFAYGTVYNQVNASTDEKGMTIFYRYGKDGRLRTVTDQEGNIVKQIDYHAEQ